MYEPPKDIRYCFHHSIFAKLFLLKRENVMLFDVSCMSFETSPQDQMILHFSLATTPQSFHHFERMPLGSTGDG
jgi:hypothetical protein